MESSQYSVDIDEVSIEDDFWSPWLVRNRDVTIEYQYDQLEASGSLANFRRVADGESGGFRGMWFQDSDAYKWLEAASFELAKADDTDLRERVDDVIDLVADAQQEDGYLNTYFQLVEPDQRWTNLHMLHELYCAGHLFEAAVAHYEATCEESLLSVATAFADHIDDMFGDEVDGVPGHEEIELGLIKLYRATDEERYLDLASYFVDLRGHDDRLAWELDHLDEIGGAEYDSDDWEGSIHDGSRTVFLDDEAEYDGSYAQAHAPVREQSATEGHSVRAMYLYAAVTEIVAERDDDELHAALDRLWQNMTTKRMYVTGGIGPEHEHEGFTEDYDLPNDTAYAETCAAIGSIFWNQRLFELTAERAYADLIERTLYNGFLSGISFSGDRFFYVNPLETDGDHHRKEWFTCACCPPNAARLFSSLGQYLYSVSGDELYVNQYVGSDLVTSVDGTPVELEQSSALPWSGDVSITVEADSSIPINLRIPSWCDDATVAVDDAAVDHDESGYVRLVRDWDGERIELSLEVETELVAAHPAVESDVGRVAAECGPLVYCAEAVDNDRPLHQYEVPIGTGIEAGHEPDLLHGVTTLDADAAVPSMDGWENALYQPAAETDTEDADMELVPYYVWNNREAGPMRIWHRRA
jgi:DUF1680 family protein